MNITRHSGDGHVRVAVTGELDMATAGRLRDHLEQTWDTERPRLLLLDFDGVTFCDSTGIGALFAAGAAAGVRGTPLQIVNVHGVTATTMRITGVRELLTRPPEDELRTESRR